VVDAQSCKGSQRYRAPPVCFPWLQGKAQLSEGSDFAEDGSVRVVAFNNGTVQHLQLREHSDARRSLIYDVVQAEPESSVM
jgi:hypothetical protein